MRPHIAHRHLCLFFALACSVLAAPLVAQERKPDEPARKTEPAASAPGDESQPEAKAETITRKLPDGVVMTADLYRRPGGAEDDPVLVCMHMTASSRGEYAPLAARMQALGFHVLSVDLRCGGEGDKGDRRTKKRYGTMNETWKSATALLGHQPSYLEAYPDVGAAAAWAKELFPRSRIGLVGASYSATLALVHAAEHPKSVDAVVALSPADCVPEWVPVKEKIKTIAVPVYITCGNTPADTDHAKPIADAIVDRAKLFTFWPQDEGFVSHHGTLAFHVPEADSRAKLWEMFAKGVEPLKRAGPKGAKPESPQPKGPEPKSGG